MISVKQYINTCAFSKNRLYLLPISLHSKKMQAFTKCILYRIYIQVICLLVIYGQTKSYLNKLINWYIDNIHCPYWNLMFTYGHFYFKLFYFIDLMQYLSCNVPYEKILYYFSFKCLRICISNYIFMHTFYVLPSTEVIIRAFITQSATLGVRTTLGELRSGHNSVRLSHVI